MAINYFDLFKLLASTGVGIYGASQQKKNNANNAGIASGIADNFKIPNFLYNREQVEERDDTNRRPGSSGRRYFTDANYTNEAGDVVKGLVSGDQNGIGGGNQITQEQAESQGVNPLDIAKGVAAGFIIPKLASAAYTGIKAGLASGSVAAGTKAALSQLGIGGASGITNASANVANFLPANPIGAIPTAVFDMAAGGANAASGIAGVNAASQTAANLGGNIAAFGADKVAPVVNYGGFHGTTGGLTSNLPPGFGGANATAGTTATANAAAPTLNTGFGGLGTGNLGLGAPQSALSNAAGLAAMAAILKMGAFDMPSGKANIEKINRERRDNIIEQKINPFTGMMEGMSGMSNADLLASQRPPETNWAKEEAAIRASGVGDVDNEVEAARMAYENNPLRAAQDAQFLAQGDNAKYYNPDMSRTNYMGKVYENNAGLTALANDSRNFFIPGTAIPLGNNNPTQNAVVQYQKFMEDSNNRGKQFQYTPNSEKETQTMNVGGIVGNNPNPNGYFLGGITDGMTDEIPANIDGEQEAALSDGEFVIPADVVSHFGNGNSNAGADKLQGMMQDVRKARTGNKNQGIQINPNEYLLRT